MQVTNNITLCNDFETHNFLLIPENYKVIVSFDEIEICQKTAAKSKKTKRRVGLNFKCLEMKAIFKKRLEEVCEIV